MVEFGHQNESIIIIDDCIIRIVRSNLHVAASGHHTTTREKMTDLNNQSHETDQTLHLFLTTDLILTINN